MSSMTGNLFPHIRQKNESSFRSILDSRPFSIQDGQIRTSCTEIVLLTANPGLRQVQEILPPRKYAKRNFRSYVGLNNATTRAVTLSRLEAGERRGAWLNRESFGPPFL